MTKGGKNPEVMKGFVRAHEGGGDDKVLIGNGRTVVGDYGSFDRVAVLAIEVLRNDKEGYEVRKDRSDEGIDGVNALLQRHGGKRFAEIGDALQRLVQRGG